MGEGAYQYKYDSIRCRDPKEVGRGALGADYVYESTGIFLTKETAEAIIDDGAKKVASSAPTKNDSQVVVSTTAELSAKFLSLLLSIRTNQRRCAGTSWPRTDGTKSK